MIDVAVICRPRVMIADRPVTALDMTIEAQVLWLVKRLRDRQETSIILITRSMRVVAGVCDYVYVVYAGKVMGQVEVFDLFANTKHPCTQGLLKSTPKLDSNKERLYTTEGVVPNVLHLPRGYNSCSRCTKAVARCLEEKPQPYDMGTDESGVSHKVRYFLYDDRNTEGSREAEHSR